LRGFSDLEGFEKSVFAHSLEELRGGLLFFFASSSSYSSCSRNKQFVEKKAKVEDFWL
jgi:hypothetical protein